MFFSKKLKKFKNIKHCFFSRKNGFSKGIYESLNCGQGSNDKKESVLKNLELVSNKIDIKFKEGLLNIEIDKSNNIFESKTYEDLEKELASGKIDKKKENDPVGLFHFSLFQKKILLDL